MTDRRRSGIGTNRRSSRRAPSPKSSTCASSYTEKLRLAREYREPELFLYDLTPDREDDRCGHLSGPVPGAVPQSLSPHRYPISPGPERAPVLAHYAAFIIRSTADPEREVNDLRANSAGGAGAPSSFSIRSDSPWGSALRGHPGARGIAHPWRSAPRPGGCCRG